jgi:hypothetical protein
MNRTLLGIVLAAVVLYAWGFLVWGVVPYPAVVWKKPVDEEVARKALREQFPERGLMEALSGRIRFLVLADRRIDSGEVCWAKDGCRELMCMSAARNIQWRESP